MEWPSIPPSHPQQSYCLLYLIVDDIIDFESLSCVLEGLCPPGPSNTNRPSTALLLLSFALSRKHERVT